MKLVDKDVLAADIEKRFDEYSSKILKHYDACTEARASELGKILVFLSTLETKEVDLEKEINLWFDYGFPNDEELLDYIKETAKHFFELGLKANNSITAADRGTAEEIIVALKRIEQDYCIDLTKEMQWLRDIVKKG